MTTARDLMMTAIDAEPRRAVDQGRLSLALAAAELADLLAAGGLTLHDDRIVPADRIAVTDRVLVEAAASLSRQEPYEPLDAWLWRRGRGLAAAYLAALDADGQLVRRRSRLPFRAARLLTADSPDHRRARDRADANEPVLAALASAAGIRDEQPDDDRGEVPGGNAGDAPGEGRTPVAVVLAAVRDAVTELEAVRQRKDIEQAAFDNVWRGL